MDVCAHLIVLCSRKFDSKNVSVNGKNEHINLKKPEMNVDKSWPNNG